MSASKLPARPNLEYLKKQAKFLLTAHRHGEASASRRLRQHVPRLSKLTDDQLRTAKIALFDAQLTIAREHGFASWTKLKSRVDQVNAQIEAPAHPLRALPDAADRGDADEVARILAAENVSQHDLDVALARSARQGKLHIAEKLIEHGADPNGEYGGNFGPILLATCEFQDPDGIQFLIDHGADVNISEHKTKYPNANTPLKMLLGGYLRKNVERKHRCIDLLIDAGATWTDDAVIDVHRGRVDSLAQRIDRDPSLLTRNFDLDTGVVLTHRGITLLHLAADLNEAAIVELLLHRGADLNAKSTVNKNGVGGQTPIYHVIGSNQGAAYPLFERLMNFKPDLNVKAAIQSDVTIDPDPNHVYAEILHLTPLEYALQYEHEPAWREASREVKRLRSG